MFNDVNMQLQGRNAMLIDAACFIFNEKMQHIVTMHSVSLGMTDYMHFGEHLKFGSDDSESSCEEIINIECSQLDL